MKRVILSLVVFVGLAVVATAATYDENLKKGAATTERNEMNVPFVKPKNWKTPYTAPSNWPIFENRGPLDRSPADKPSKVLVLGSGDPMPNPFRFGPAMAVIINDYPYFVDCGEGWWRALGKATLSQGALDLPSIFALTNLKYMFLTHLHEDHTVGLPSFISNPFKFGVNGNKKVYGPEGVDEMMGHINAAYRIDRNEMFQGSIGQHGDGGTALGIPIRPSTGLEGTKIFEDQNVIVYAYPTSHGALEHTYAYRFITKPDNRILVLASSQPVCRATRRPGVAAALTMPPLPGRPARPRRGAPRCDEQAAAPARAWRALFAVSGHADAPRPRPRHPRRRAAPAAP